ncbi:MAG: FAD-dependent oxidoreductase, partial [bacterium]|nr:FAD-dependent oxidoreductase [bacterium]
LAGARQGLTVLCLEKADRIGGNAVRSGVTMWEPGVGGTGFPFEIYSRLRGIPDAVGVYSFGRHFSWDGRESFPGGEHVVDPTRHYIDTLRRHRSREKQTDPPFRKEYWHGVIFEPDAYEQVLREMLKETGKVTIATETTFASIDVADGRITGMTLTNGRRVTANAYIDGTGGGALCKAAGCEMLYGQESRVRFNEPSAPVKPNDRINGATLIFRVTKTDTPGIEPLPEGIPENCWWGGFGCMSAVRYPNGDYNCNMLPTMRGVDFAKLGYAKAYEECLRRVSAFWRYVQKGWPEFQSYRIAWIAPALGVRETSRVLGEYVLSENDLRAGVSGQTHPDIITIADHSFDRHGEGGGGELGEPYGVPYRCLVPKGYTNLLVACRGSSFSSLAASSCRLSRTMMQLGQAAGTAACLAKAMDVDLPNVPPDQLRDALRAQHVEVDWPRTPEIEKHLAE